ncbi:MAG: type II toxin-antitoxin system VapC family toxin [Bacillota bacterium]
MSKKIPSGRNMVFVDTSAWIMLLNQDESRHEEAVETYNGYLKNKVKLTSNMVIAETYTWLRRRIGYKNAMDFLKIMHQMQEEELMVVVWSNTDIENIAFRYLQKYDDHELSFVDAVSFAIMDEMSIKETFTFDRHFSITGFIPLNSL